MNIDWTKEQILIKYDCINKLSYGKNTNILTNECQQYLDLYKALCVQVFRLRKPCLDNQIYIAQSIYFTHSDYKKKTENLAYYRGNCSAFDIVLRHILKKLQDQSTQELTSKKLRGLIRRYLLDSLRLINHYQSKVENITDQSLQHFQISLSNNPDYSLYYDTCEQIVFGEVDFDDPSDQSEVSPALIRIMIELRLKWSMGISGYMVSNSPGNMNAFFEVYKSFIDAEKIIISSDFDVVKRIYEWGNIFIHTGIRSYAWLTGFAINLLNPLFYGEKHRASGVRVLSQATIYEFWDNLKDHYIQRSNNKDINIEIFPYKPGFVCTYQNFDSFLYHNHYSIYEDCLSEIASGDKVRAIDKMRWILQQGVQTIGNSLYERVKSKYVDLRTKEIKERAYYLWLRRASHTQDADCDWYTAIEEDIASK